MSADDIMRKAKALLTPRMLYGWWSDEQAERNGEVLVCLNAAGVEVRVTEMRESGTACAFGDARFVGMVQRPPLWKEAPPTAPWWLSLACVVGEGDR